MGRCLSLAAYGMRGSVYLGQVASVVQGTPVNIYSYTIESFFFCCSVWIFFLFLGCFHVTQYLNYYCERLSFTQLAWLLNQLAMLTCACLIISTWSLPDESPLPTTYTCQITFWGPEVLESTALFAASNPLLFACQSQFILTKGYNCFAWSKRH